MSRQLSDWLEHYLQFTQNSEPPTIYHLWSGITAISSALRRKCYCNWGSRGYVYPNLYIALVGPPAGRKGTAMKITKTMLQPLELPIGSDALGSVQILYEEVKRSEDEYIEVNGVLKKHKSLSVWSEEFQVFLSDRDPMLIASLTDLFDCADTWKYSTIKRGATDLSFCWLTIIGAITPALLQAKLTQNAVGGGLLSRIIFIVGYGAKTKIALPFYSQEELTLQQQLAEDLQEIALMTGPFILTNEFLTAYSKWYEGNTNADGIDDKLILGYNGRRPLHLNKLCMILSASESNEMEIHKRHFDKALAILVEAEAEMPNAFYGLGRGLHADVYASILRFIESKDNFSWSEIMDTFQLDTKGQELQEFMTMAEQTGKVKVEHSATTTKYEVIHKEEKKVDRKFLNDTLYKRMV